MKKQTFLDDVVYSQMPSPVGVLTLLASASGLQGIFWDHDEVSTGLKREDKHPILQETKRQLREYFQGKRQKFDLPLVMEGTDFQVRAWKALQKIPYAKTFSYGQQAEKVGGKNYARAVGMANGKNPLAIVVPCHRVVGKNGDLTGFGGGLKRKAFLLELEQNS